MVLGWGIKGEGCGEFFKIFRINMLILTELDSKGNIVMDYGSPLTLSAANEYFDIEHDKSLNYLKDRMLEIALIKPEANLAILKQEYRIVLRNKNEPLYPCGA